jgi:hypothetical protein
MAVYCSLVSAGNTLGSDTIGVLWRAASGTVDPWTKAEIVQQNATDRVKASAGTICINSAISTAQSDTCNQLGNNNANPSQFFCGVKNSFANIPQKVKDLLTGNNYHCGDTCTVLPKIGTWAIVVIILAIIILISFGYAKR